MLFYIIHLGSIFHYYSVFRRWMLCRADENVFFLLLLLCTSAVSLNIPYFYFCIRFVAPFLFGMAAFAPYFSIMSYIICHATFNFHFYLIHFNCFHCSPCNSPLNSSHSGVYWYWNFVTAMSQFNFCSFILRLHYRQKFGVTLHRFKKLLKTRNVCIFVK